jgi:hypothetical protein
MIFFRLALTASALCGAAALQAQTVNLWAVGDALRVSPVTGKLIEDRSDIHKDYPSGDQRGKNSVWDAASKTVSLVAARNEYVAFQLIIDAPAPVDGIDVKLDGLASPSGGRLAGGNVAIFKEWYVRVTQASSGYPATSLGNDWYPDALMPIRPAGSWAGGFPFSIPDIYNKIPFQRNHAVWIDIFVPHERSQAPPGRYTGKLGVVWQGGRDSVTVNLDIWDFALPQESHLRGDLWNGSMRQMPPEEELLYYQLLKQHRAFPLIYSYRPGIKINGTSVSLDWTEFDKRLAPYIDGSAFTRKRGYSGPGYGVPISHFMLPFDIKRKSGNAWPPVDVPEGGPTPEYEAIWKETARQVRAHLDANPNWAGILKIAYLNGLDESYDEESYALMTYYGRLLHAALGRGWFKYRIDGGYSRQAIEKMSGEVELWVCHTVSFEHSDQPYFRAKGIDTWFYGPMIYESRRSGGCGTNSFIDQDLTMERAIPWVAWKYRSGWVQWEFDHNAYSAWYDAETVKRPGRACNGSGQLIYRGAVVGYREPVPSIRLKSLRRGLQDYEYFWLLEQKTGGKEAPDRLVNDVIYQNPFGKDSIGELGVWKRNPDEWDKARRSAGEQLAQTR